jgi:hypothetical protein
MAFIKIEKDKERARSLYRLALLRYSKIEDFDPEDESSLIIEAYYEVIKELMTALLFCYGYKTLSHKELMDYFKDKPLTGSEFEIVDDLRKRRNRLVYYGAFQPPFYVRKNGELFEGVIDKLKSTLEDKFSK